MKLLRPVYDAISAVLNDGAFANLALKELPDWMSTSQRAFVCALTYEVLERLLYLDYVICAFTNGRRPDRRVMNVLRMGACLVLFMKGSDAVAVNDCVALAKSVGKGASAGFVNAVLRSLVRNKGNLPPLPEDPVERISIQRSCPAHIVRSLIADYGLERTDALLARVGRTTTVRPARGISARELADELRSLGVEFCESALVPGAFKLRGTGEFLCSDLFASGRATVESEGSMLACLALDPRPGQRILDACAAPGGKTAFIHQLCGGMAQITAVELHEHRVELVRATLRRMGISNVNVLCADASCTAFPEEFDSAIVDAPCSCINAASKPDARYNKSADDLCELPRIQLGILGNVSRYLRPGGTLVYSTCTILKNENERVVERFLRENSDYEPRPLCSELFAAARGQDGCATLLPDEDGADGFFIARLRRKDTLKRKG